MSKLCKTDEGYMHECPGCGSWHLIWVGQPNHLGAKWDFDGDEEKPTFRPSVRVSWPNQPGKPQQVCHYFITRGQIQYCSDSTHLLAGKTVDIPEWED